MEKLSSLLLLYDWLADKMVDRLMKRRKIGLDRKERDLKRNMKFV